MLKVTFFKFDYKALIAYFKSNFLNKKVTVGWELTFWTKMLQTTWKNVSGSPHWWRSTLWVLHPKRRVLFCRLTKPSRTLNPVKAQLHPAVADVKHRVLSEKKIRFGTKNKAHFFSLSPHLSFACYFPPLLDVIDESAWLINSNSPHTSTDSQSIDFFVHSFWNYQVALVAVLETGNFFMGGKVIQVWILDQFIWFNHQHLKKNKMSKHNSWIVFITRYFYWVEYLWPKLPYFYIRQMSS